MIGVGGLRRFAGYAMAPNERGFCGPTDHDLLRGHLQAGTDDDRLDLIARAFSGPLPYLRVIADAAGVADVFDPAVVEAYWLGNDLLEEVDPHVCADAVMEAFRGQPTVDPRRIVATRDGASPHHGYHVLVTYPWLDLVADGRYSAMAPLDSCRIRPAVLRSVRGSTAEVTVRALAAGPGGIAEGPPSTQTVRLLDRPDGPELQPGDHVSLHWDHLCDRLTAVEAAQLTRRTGDVVRLVNRCLLGR